MLVLAAGFIIIDLIAAELPSIAKPGEVIFVEEGIRVHLGGHPANLSADLIKLGFPPREIAVIGAVGEDFFGDFAIATLSALGVRPLLIRIPSTRTGKNLILVVRNEDRRFHVDPGANDALTPSYLLSKVKEYEPKLFYMAAGLTGLVDKVLDKVLAEVKNYGSITFLDLIEPRGDIRDKLRESLRYVDIIHCNYLEAKALTGEEGIEAILQELTKLGVRMITITLGGKGAYLRLGNLTIYQPSFKVEVIDPTGAGDAFCAGLIKKLYELNRLTSLPPQDRGVLSDILLYAQAVGAVKCTGIGASTAISESSVRRLIKMQGDRLRELEKFI